MSSPARYLSAIDASQFSATQADARSLSWLGYAERLLDMIAVVAAVFVTEVGYHLLRAERATTYPPSTLLLCATGFALLFVFLLDRYGGYRPCVSLLAIRETERILRVTLQAFSIALVAAYFCLAYVSRLTLGLVLILVPLFVSFEKWEMLRLLRRLRSKGYGTRRAVILGSGNAARRIFTALVRSPKFGVKPVAFVDKRSGDAPTEIYECGYQREESAPVLCGPLCPEMFRQLDASVLVIADTALDREAMRVLVAKAAEAGVTTYFAPGEFLEPGYWLRYSELDGIMLAQLSRGSNRAVYEFGKRVLDVAGALAATLCLAPVALVVAVAVKLSSPGPVLFRQERVGKEGRLFPMYKFRSMYVDVPKYGYSPVAGEDSRLTSVGRLLRRTSLDEMPQLVNVLLGHMSLVGPRPEMPFIVEQYTPMQQQRLAVKPGITGLWQISADRAFLIHQNLEYDLYYVQHRSLFMDVAIVLHTVLRAAHGV